MHEEALHGFVAPAGTSFPQALGLAATFDPALNEQIFAVAARQARARGVQHVLAPVLDVARDPRWGRIEETYGEDPYLVTRMGVAAIQGFQGRHAAGAPVDAQHVLATAKHFTAHGTPEGGRNTAPGNYSPHVVREVFLPPFEAAVREAGVATVMASYNELDGMPSHANHWLLTDLLRGEYGFPGLVVSDYFGVAEFERKHHVVADLPAAGRKALEAGVDLEVPEAEGFKTLVADQKAGRVTQASIDRAVARVLRAKFLLGLFEHPYVDAKLEGERPADRALARQAADEAIVLLKNSGNLLPLDAARLKTIAVIGPNAATVRLGGYSGVPDRPVSVVDGLRAKLGDKVKVVTAPGCGLTTGNRGWSDDLVMLPDPREDAHLTVEAAKLAATADVVLLVLGQNEQLSREGWADNHVGDRMTLDLPGKQMELARAVLATGKPTVLLLIHGSPLSINELARTVPAILDGFYLGEETGDAVADVLFGDVSPSGKAPLSTPRSVGTIPAYYNYKPSARRLYLFEEPGPLWAFGSGLSYTTFSYDKLAVKPERIAPDGHTTVSVTVTNTGKRAADEVVQLYIHDLGQLDHAPGPGAERLSPHPPQAGRGQAGRDAAGVRRAVVLRRARQARRRARSLRGDGRRQLHRRQEDQPRRRRALSGLAPAVERPAHQLGQRRGLRRLLPLQARDGAGPIGVGPVLTELELGLEAFDRHLETDNRSQEPGVEVRRHRFDAPGTRTVFIFVDQRGDGGLGDIVFVRGEGLSVGVHHGVVPGRHGRRAGVPGRRDVALRAVEDGDRWGRAVHRPPMIVVARDVADQHQAALGIAPHEKRRVRHERSV